jgi:ParB family chromosome partitioning protein
VSEVPREVVFKGVPEPSGRSPLPFLDVEKSAPLYGLGELCTREEIGSGALGAPTRNRPAPAPKSGDDRRARRQRDMSEQVSGSRVGNAGRAVPDVPEASALAARALGSAEAALGVELREIALDDIEPDPAQPRRVFDEAKLQALAASIRKYGVLQEPGVVCISSSGGARRYRLIWGERRWRASRIAGLPAIRCKVLPRPDESAVDQLRTKEQQWAENMEREGLSPIEEAIAIQDAAELERKLRPDVALGELIEKLGEERGLSGMVARNLVSLLKAPRSLQSALMSRSIGRELGFELCRLWNRLLDENEQRGEARREIKYRTLVEAWARARGGELDVAAMNRYAAETFQDPKVVKATCRKAEESQRAVLERFDAVVARAQKEGWTVAKARSELAEYRRSGRRSRGAKPATCFEHAGKGNARLTVHLDRVRDPAVATPEALETLLGVLRDLTGEVEKRRRASLAGLEAG